MKLPGSKRNKIIFLILLVIISIVIISVEIYSHKKIDANQNEEIQTEIESSSLDEEKNKQEVVEDEEEQRLYNDAYSLFTSGDYKNAISKADEIIQKFPDSYKGYTIRGFSKAFNDNFDKAMRDIDKALSIKDDDWYARYAKAFTYELYGKFDEALEWYDKSLELKEYMWTYYGKASIYGRKGDAANTVVYLKKAIETENVKREQSGIIKEAKTEKDFDPVRGNAEFENIIK